MKKFNPTQRQKHLGLLLYFLYKNLDSIEAFQITSLIHFDGDKIYAHSPEGEMQLKAWLELGCRVNFAWIEQKAHLDDLTMGQQAFGKLRQTDLILHSQMHSSRNRASKRWSNDWNRIIESKHLAGRTLSMAKPNLKVLSLTWQSVLSECSRMLLKAGMEADSSEILNLTFESLCLPHQVA